VTPEQILMAWLREGGWRPGVLNMSWTSYPHENLSLLDACEIQGYRERGWPIAESIQAIVRAVSAPRDAEE